MGSCSKAIATFARPCFLAFGCFFVWVYLCLYKKTFCLLMFHGYLIPLNVESCDKKGALVFFFWNKLFRMYSYFSINCFLVQWRFFIFSCTNTCYSQCNFLRLIKSMDTVLCAKQYTYSILLFKSIIFSVIAILVNSCLNLNF